MTVPAIGSRMAVLSSRRACTTTCVSAWSSPPAAGMVRGAHFDDPGVDPFASQRLPQRGRIAGAQRATARDHVDRFTRRGRYSWVEPAVQPRHCFTCACELGRRAVAFPRTDVHQVVVARREWRRPQLPHNVDLVDHDVDEAGGFESHADVGGHRLPRVVVAGVGRVACVARNGGDEDAARSRGPGTPRAAPHRRRKRARACCPRRCSRNCPRRTEAR